MAEDEKKDQENSDTELKKLGENQKEIETKLNRLLDGYLDQVVEPEVYKEKKNELFEEKLKITEQIAKISKSGSSWLEPMKEFVISALQAQKIAAAKNECHDLAIMAKTVGSNYSLFNRQLRPDLKYPFAALSAERGAASAAPNSLAISKMVSPEGVEPSSTG